MLEDKLHGRKAEVFTLQWHLTHACDLHCAHCYDRSKMSALKLDDCIEVLDQLEVFCEAKGVRPNVCLSGGNPFLYKWFFELYQNIVDRGWSTSILGNPVEREELKRLVEIQKPRYFQVSLEGLEAHNDEIRGEGFYERVLAFLPLLREFEVRSVIMTTLTSGNMDQIVPLGRLLQGKVDRFTFNRLSQVGEGAALGLPDKEAYGKFLVEYQVAQKQNSVFKFKDNLFNIFRHEFGQKLIGGCTGFGCGAAFNFVALLPDGEVHACRKFPSKIGSVQNGGFMAAYDSSSADQYRRGCSACDGCAIRAKCGGCLAVTSGQGKDPFTEVDPHCFIND